jgi:hypothetical protein
LIFLQEMIAIRATGILLPIKLVITVAKILAYDHKPGKVFSLVFLFTQVCGQQRRQFRALLPDRSQVWNTLPGYLAR